MAIMPISPLFIIRCGDSTLLPDLTVRRLPRGDARHPLNAIGGPSAAVGGGRG